MFREPSKLSTKVLFVLFAGLTLMLWQAGPLEAAGGAPTLSLEPELVVNVVTDPQPAAGNGAPFNLLIGIRQIVGTQNTIQHVFQPVDTDSVTFTPLEGPLEFKSECHADDGLPEKFVRCLVMPREGAGAWDQGPGHLFFVLGLTTADGDVAETVMVLRVAPPPPPPPPPPPE